METRDLKALARKVLQKNTRGNQVQRDRFPKETRVETQRDFLGNFPPTDIGDILANPSDASNVKNWLEFLSDSERDIFEERAAIMEYDGGMHRELAEVEAIKRIIKERVISGKCDKCERVNGCMLTKGQRNLCAVVKDNIHQ